MADVPTPPPAEIVTTRTTSKGGDDAATPEEHVAVKVMVRVRPFSQKEINEEKTEPISVVFMDNGTRVSILDHTKSYAEKEAFEFDATFWSLPPEQNQVTEKKEIATQETVFNRTGMVAVDASMSGYNATIFAYGQTGSGKTHTMFGTVEDPGITLRLLKYLFDTIARTAGSTKAQQQQSGCKATVELSFFEIYNEKVKDLLNEHSGPTKHGKKQAGVSNSSMNAYPHSSDDEAEGKDAKGGARQRGKDAEKEQYSECKVRYTPTTGTYVEGLRRIEVGDIEACTNLLKFGMEHRSVAATKMNDTSSRSHAVLQLCVKQKDALHGTLRVSLINLVDLAGSERVKMSGVQGTALTEAKNINLSLSTLRRVIDILIENSTKKKKTVPPYRESLLTWLLSDSLGGNSRTTMLAMISPAVSNVEDTLNTLRYANKAKSIVCSVRVNEQRTAVVVGALKAEMEELRNRLRQNAENENQEAQKSLKEELERREAEWKAAAAEQSKLEEEQAKLKTEVVKQNEVLAALSANLEKKMEDAENVKRYQEETTEKQKLAVVQQMEAEQLAAKRKMDEEELQFQLKRHESMTHKMQDRQKAMEQVADESRALVQQHYASIFRNCKVLQNDKFELAKAHEMLDTVKEKYARVEPVYRKCMEQHGSHIEEKKRLLNFVQDFEQRLARKAEDVEAHEVAHQKKERALQAEIRAVQEATREVQAKAESASQELDALKKLRASSTLAHDIQSLEDELAVHTKYRDELDGKIRALEPEVEIKRSSVQRAKDVHTKSKTVCEVLSGEYTAVNECKERYDTILSDLVSEHRDIAAEVAKRQAGVDEANAELGRQEAQRNTILRSHQKLKDYVCYKFFRPPPGSSNRSGSPYGRIPTGSTISKDGTVVAKKPSDNYLSVHRDDDYAIPTPEAPMSPKSSKVKRYGAFSDAVRGMESKGIK